MAFINVGAYINGARPKSKKALKDALKDAPATVTFDRTSVIGPGSVGGPIKGDALPEGDILSVTGPDPYTSRKWYASVKLNGKGGISAT